MRRLRVLKSLFAVRSSVAFGEFYAERKWPRGATLGDDMEEALMAQGEVIRKEQYRYRVVYRYRGVDLLLCAG
jgi:hypothetical protein